MPDLDAFEAEVKAKIKQLSSKDAKARLQAATWLGEAGDPSAITALAQVYKNDADPRVKQAAGYSLGMFRRLEQELEGDGAETAMALLQRVALEGRMGGRPRIATRALVKLELALLLSAILVAVGAFVLPSVIRGGGLSLSLPSFETVDNGEPTQVAASVPDKDRATIVNELRGALSLATNNATKLQGQYQLVLGGGQLPCNEFFDTLTPTALSANDAGAFPDLAQISTDINQAQTDLSAAKATYDRVCGGGESLSAGDFGGPMGSTVAVIQRLPAIETALTTAAAVQAESPTSAPADANVTPTVEQVAPEPSVDLRPHLTALQNIIDAVTEPRGAYTVLQQYWTEVSSGGTQGCSDPFNVATIPADYALPAEIMPAAPTLKLSADLVNTGLRALRDGWQTFGLACNDGTLAQIASDNLVRMDAAKQAFDNAARQIASLRSGA
jgi:hypothetical protein